MKKKLDPKKEHFELILKALETAGYGPDQPTDYELIDIWGVEYVTLKTKRQCFLEIYNMHGDEVHIDNDGFAYTSWQVDYDSEETIQLTSKNDKIYGTEELISALHATGLLPLGKKAVKK